MLSADFLQSPTTNWKKKKDLLKIMFDDDIALKKYVLQPLFTHRTALLETTSADLSHPTHIKVFYLLAFARSLRVTMIQPTKAPNNNNNHPNTTAEDLYQCLRPYLFVESIVVEHMFDKHSLQVIAKSINRFVFLTCVLCNAYFATLIPYPSQLRTLNITIGSLPQTVLDRFTNLEELHVSDGGVDNVFFCSGTLRRLFLTHCPMGNAGLARATKLEVVGVSYCPNITSLAPFAATLVEVHAGGDCGISDVSLRDAVNIRRLYAQGNKKITTVAPFAANLVELDAFSSGISDSGLSEATSIVKLRIGSLYPRCEMESEVTTVAPFAKTLRELDASMCSIGDNGLCNATGIVKVQEESTNLTTVMPFAKTLRELHSFSVDGCKGLQDSSFPDATGIVRLFIAGCGVKPNCLITTVKPFRTSLLELSLCNVVMTDDGIRDATSLVKLNAYRAISITTVTPFARTLRELRLCGCSRIRVEDALCEAPAIGRLIVGAQIPPNPTPTVPLSVWDR